MKITPDIAIKLKCYVYVYTDPRNGKPFYIGKGQGNRVFSHLDDPLETEKTLTIQAIRKSGTEPQIDILRYGLTESEANLVEASAIDLIGCPHLTNRVAGHHDRSFGRIGSMELIQMLSAKPVFVRHKAILITINKLYRSNMSDEELYEATRGIWVVGQRREHAVYGMAVYQGIVREVYQIKQWHPAGTLPYRTRNAEAFKRSGRWEFVGHVATNIRDEYVGNSVGLGGQNPIRYINI